MVWAVDIYLDFKNAVIPRSQVTVFVCICGSFCKDRDDFKQRRFENPFAF